MALLYDPIYPLHVPYAVSESIWQLHEIHFWQFLLNSWGKNRVFRSLQFRYEKRQNLYEGRALLIVVMAFLLSFIIKRLMNWYADQLIARDNNQNLQQNIVNGNHAKDNDVNGADRRHTDDDQFITDNEPKKHN
ncbi:uncharacterized protein LOC128961028 [Oppia nitens]|uniref:uncharacterized protein LOC128961028 n=1 Tax=Oppia nitens TaxID=1686743 RepID=UPI0023DBB14B|nr:uncharacterized protein LOC128961028 [Oppia nitens]